MKAVDKGSVIIKEMTQLKRNEIQFNGATEKKSQEFPRPYLSRV